MESTNARDLDRRLADLVPGERHLVSQFVVEMAGFAKRELYRELGYTSLFLLLRPPARAVEVLCFQAIGSGSSDRPVPPHPGSPGGREAVDSPPRRICQGGWR